MCIEYGICRHASYAINYGLANMLWFAGALRRDPRLLNTSAYPRHRTRNPLDPAVELTFRDFYCLHNGNYENLQIGTSLKNN